MSDTEWMSVKAQTRFTINSEGDPIFVVYGPKEGADERCPWHARLAFFSNGRVWIEGAYYNIPRDKGLR